MQPASVQRPPGAARDDRREEIRRANRALTMKLGVIVVAMFGFGYLLVPFYEKICQVTGLRDIDRADAVVNTQVDKSRTIKIEFDTNLRNLPWDFRALQLAETGKTADVPADELKRLESGAPAPAGEHGGN